MIRLQETTVINAPIHRCFDLARSVEVHLTANVHSGEQVLAVGGITSGLVGLGQQVTWRAKHFGIWHNLTSETTSLESPFHFQVTMVRGIFSFMQADHMFRSLPSSATEMRDIFAIAAPVPLLGPVAEVLFLRRYMLVLVRERNAVIKLSPPSGSAICRLLKHCERMRCNEDRHSRRHRSSWAHPCPPLSPRRAFCRCPQPWPTYRSLACDPLGRCHPRSVDRGTRGERRLHQPCW